MGCLYKRQYVNEGGIGEVIAAIMLAGVVVALLISSVIPLGDGIQQVAHSFMDYLSRLGEKMDIQ